MESAGADALKQQARHILSSVLCPNTFSARDRLNALENVTLGDARAHADRIRVAKATEVRQAYLLNVK